MGEWGYKRRGDRGAGGSLDGATDGWRIGGDRWGDKGDKGNGWG